MKVDALRLQVVCDTCTSPDMPDFVARTHSESAQEQITQELNAFVTRMISHLYSDYAHQETMRYVHQRSATCPQSSGLAPLSPSPTSGPPAPAMEEGCYPQQVEIIATAGGCGLLTTLYLLYRCFCHQKIKQKLSNMKHHTLQHVNKPLLPPTTRRPRFTTQEYVLTKRNVSLLFHPAIHWSVRYGVLVSIAVNLVLFVSGHTSVGECFFFNTVSQCSRLVVSRLCFNPLFQCFVSIVCFNSLLQYIVTIHCFNTLFQYFVSILCSKTC